MHKKINKSLITLVAASSLGAVVSTPIVEASGINVESNLELGSSWKEMQSVDSKIYIRSARPTPEQLNLHNQLNRFKARDGIVIDFIIPKDTPVGTTFKYDPVETNRVENLGLTDKEAKYVSKAMEKFKIQKNEVYYYDTQQQDFRPIMEGKQVKTFDSLDDAKGIRGPNGEPPVIAVNYSQAPSIVFHIIGEVPHDIYSISICGWEDIGRLEDASAVFGVRAPKPNGDIESIVNREIVPFEIEKRENPNLDIGVENVIREGEDGILLEVLTQPTLDGVPVGVATSRLKYKKHPINKIIEIGTKVPDIKDVRTSTTEEVIPYETETVHDPNLEKGEIRLTQEGVNGLKKVITEQPYLNGYPNGMPTIREEVLVEPINEIWSIGEGVVEDIPTESEETIPYKTIYRHNKELPAGERRTLQEGKHGRKKVETIQKTLNGEPIGTPNVIETVIEDKIDEIIELGSGIEDELKTDLLKVIPYETEEVENPDLLKGERRVVQEGAQGIMTVRTVQKRFNNEPVGEQVITEEVTKEPVNKIVEIGTGTRMDDIFITTEPIPFETERIEVDTLPKGVEKVVQEGVEGVLLVKTTTVIKNGKPVGEPIVVREPIQEPINKIVHVGVGEESTPEKPSTPEQTPEKPKPQEQPQAPESRPEEPEKSKQVPEKPEQTPKQAPESRPEEPEKQGQVPEKPKQSKPQVTTEPIPFKTEYIEVDTLAKGEERVKQKGVEGEKEITTIGSNVSERITKEPVKEIIELGIGIKDTFTNEKFEPIPFKTEQVLNTQLAKGEERVKQEGVEGSKKIIETVETIDGEPVGTPSIKEEVVQNPVNRIIEYNDYGVEVDSSTTPDQKADVKTGIENVATNPTFLTGLGVSVAAILGALGFRKYKKKNDDE